jgi:hypothetical protein
MEIKLSDVYWTTDYTIETTKNKGELTIEIENNGKGNGFYPKYKVTITTDKDTYTRDDIGTPDDGPLAHYISLFLKQNIKIKVYDKNGEEIIETSEFLHNEGTYTFKYNKPSKKLDKIMEALKELPQTKTDLRFCQFKTITDSYIMVEYYGHEVGGSYVHDWEVAPNYEEKLGVETNRVVTWTKGRRSGGFGADIYEFKVHLKKIIDKDIENREVTGKMFHIDGKYAFRSCPGMTWSYMYGIAKKINDGDIVRGLTRDTDGNIFYEDLDGNKTKMFKVHVEPSERDASSTNSGRTWYKGTFELFLDETEMQKLYLEAYGRNNSCKARIVYPPNVSAKLEKTFRDGTTRIVYPGYM